ncbi:MAG: 30S ribosomal protein S18 [Candidatus Saccharimonadales bacterium]
MAIEENRQDNRQDNKRQNNDFFDYKDFKRLQRFVNNFGQIESRKRTNLSEKQQNKLSKAIKRARHIALLPFEQQ